MIWNLLSNAIKFTPRDGEARIATRRAGAYLEITVTDTGKGIAPEFLPYVFERFRQADASTTRRFGGLGLGLSIVKSLVEMHGGTVRRQRGRRPRHDDHGAAAHGRTTATAFRLKPEATRLPLFFVASGFSRKAA